MTTIIDISTATVVTLCIVGILWWLLKRKKKAKPAKPAPQPQDPQTPPK